MMLPFGEKSLFAQQSVHSVQPCSGYVQTMMFIPNVGPFCRIPTEGFVGRQ